MVLLLSACKRSKVSSVRSKVSGSRVPKPSSINRLLIYTFFEAKSDRPSAKAKLIKNVSPPDKVFTDRRSSPM